jgi:glucuronoarabinoxylan endo-1,4-beta-xylanase
MRKFLVVVLTLFALSLTACGGGSGSVTNPPPPPPPPPVTGAMTTVDFGTTHQAIRGFGGAEAWFSVMPSAAINELFGTGSGQIGLSILRIRIDPSSTTAGTQWDAELTNAKNAMLAGSNVSIIATPWTPPAAWKINPPDPTQPLWGGSLDLTNHSADYANYLESYVTYAANKGVNLYGISMQNEPDAPVTTYEACVWTPAQMDTWVANYGSVLTTKLIMPESESFNTSFSDPALSDPNAVGKIGIVAGHLYGSSPAPYPNAVNAGKELWMTEHYLNLAGAQPTVTDALAAAKEIHDSLTAGQYNAYVWWWAQDVSSQNSFTGLIDSNNNVKFAGEGMAQFSRFVRPGYVRVDAAYSTPSVYVSAYKGNGHYVIVALNMSTSDVSQPFTIQNQSISSMVPYQTTATSQVAQQSAVSVSGNQFTYTLPAQSITTFVQ